MSKQPPAPVHVTLRDGTKILMRPVVADDKQHLREALGRLSDKSRYRRFLAPIRDLSDVQLKYLTEIDYDNHMAWGALAPALPELGGLGIARYVRSPEDPRCAEAAVTVLDSFHGRGLGTQLLTVLSQTARSNGIERFCGYVLQENTPMMKILYSLGAHITPAEDGLVRVETRIPETGDELSDTPTSRVMRAVARQIIPPLAVRFLHADLLEKVLRLFQR